MLDLKDFSPDPIHLQTAEAFSDCPHAVFLLSHLAKAISCGHICLPLDEFDQSSQDILEKAIKEIQGSLLTHQDFAKPYPMYLEHRCLYMHKSYRYETLFYHELNRYLQTLHDQPSALFEPQSDLSEKQNQALKVALSSGLLLLTGGPGTGKTYTAKKIAYELVHKSSYFKKTLILTAPTSKAVDNLKKSIGTLPEVEIIAETLHKLVDFFTKKPTYLNASCVIVDEASMIEAPIMAKLFQSLGSSAKLIMMGDPFQLPPVGLGSFFQDLIELKDLIPFVNHVHLDQIHRCNIKEIVALASLTNSSSFEEFFDFLHLDHKHIQLIKYPLTHMGEDSLSLLKDFFKHESFYLDHLEDLQNQKIHTIILSTLRQGPCGTEQINSFLSHHYQHRQLKKRYYLEPIILEQTDKARGLFNGQIGFKIYDRKMGKECFYIHDQILNKLDLDYSACFALSVHKSQGSEFKNVLFMLPQGSEKFSREIIYTAITRVKNKLWVWVDKEPLKEALSKKNERFSGLKYRIQSDASLAHARSIEMSEFVEGKI